LTDAYAAGLVDGEATIGIHKPTASQPTYHVRLDCSMSEKALPVLQAIQARYGGQLRKMREATDRWEAAWSWRLLERQLVREMLAAIRPHLILKREQANVAERLLDLIDSLPQTVNGKAKWTAEAREDGAVLKALMNDLNQKGPSVPRQAGWFARYVGGRFLTDQGSLLEATRLARFSGTWPRSGSMRDGRVFEHPTSALPTDESDSSSLLRTPTLSGYEDNRGGGGELRAGIMHGPSRRLPTPSARDHKGRNQRDDASCLTGALLPTPRVSDSTGPGKHGDGGPDLRTSLGDLTKPPSEGGSE